MCRLSQERGAAFQLPDFFVTCSGFMMARNPSWAGRAGNATCQAICFILLITGLALAVALTIAWDGLLAYGVIVVIRAL